MPNFNIADELEDLTYDFRPYVDAHGVVPEPTETMIKNFRKAMRKNIGDHLEKIATEEDPKKKQELVKAAVQDGSISEESMDKKIDAMYAAVARVCQNEPSYDQIKGLPWRGQRVFVGWVIGKLLSPEA